MTESDRPVRTGEPAAVVERRRLLRVGGLGALGVIAAACSKSTTTTAPKIKAQQTGNAPTTNPNQPPPTLGPRQPTKTQQEDDLANLRTATSMEYAIISAYQALTSQTVTSGGAEFDLVVPIFRDHHQAAITTLQTATRDALETAQSGPNKEDFAKLTPAVVVYEPGKLKDEKGQPDKQGNAWFWANVIEPTLPSLATANDVIDFAHRLETIAVATYAVSAGTYSTADLRHQAMVIGAVEARHTAKLALLQTPPKPGAPDSIFFTRDGLGIDALLTFDAKPSTSAAGG